MKHPWRDLMLLPGIEPYGPRLVAGTEPERLIERGAHVYLVARGTKTLPLTPNPPSLVSMISTNIGP